MNHKVSHEKKIEPTKYPREKTLDQENTHEKNSGPTKYRREKVLVPRNTHEKKFRTHEIPTKALWQDGTRPTRPRWHVTH